MALLETQMNDLTLTMIKVSSDGADTLADVDGLFAKPAFKGGACVRIAFGLVGCDASDCLLERKSALHGP